MTQTQIIMEFLSPPMLFIVLAVAGVLFNRMKFGRMCLGLGLALLLASFIPGIGVVLSLPLLATHDEWTAKDFQDARVIVVPSGGYYPDDVRFRPGENSFERADLGLMLQKQTGLPLLLTGGRTFHPDAPSEANVLRENLGLDAGSVILEEESLNSNEHTLNLERLFAERGLGNRIVLVTSAMHMTRVAAAFRARGFKVIPLSANDLVTDFMHQAHPLQYVVPSWRGIKIFRQAFYSYAGILSYWVRGYLGFTDLIPDGPSCIAPPNQWIRKK